MLPVIPATMANANLAVRFAIEHSGYATIERRVLGEKLGSIEPQFRINSGPLFSFVIAAFFPQHGTAVP
ncbi:hypothetical protein [Bradyrhizobium sp. STM 3843]|uniref:hypothetical protein n=1 Tax=Bradyrhizobium sp. STM 3843 TaxID=551947 RepID=UPI001112AF10|nr:hypothetical protein [Bradyrhizobium sp. STM 3843]